MGAEKLDAVVLAGDTPYIDSTDLTKQRSRHCAFAAVVEYQDLLSSRPFWSTWGDRDFGRNDADGTLKRKVNIHVTRLLKYPSEVVGYPLYDFISSPMHARTIPLLNLKHPYLVESKVQPNTFLTLTADTTAGPAALTARFLDKDGKSLFADTTIRADELTPKGR